jgi:hypothetical protein
LNDSKPSSFTGITPITKKALDVYLKSPWYSKNAKDFEKYKKMYDKEISEIDNNKPLNNYFLSLVPDDKAGKVIAYALGSENYFYIANSLGNYESILSSIQHQYNKNKKDKEFMKSLKGFEIHMIEDDILNAKSFMENLNNFYCSYEEQHRTEYKRELFLLFLVSFIPPIILYLIGLSIAWIIKGFKNK